MPTVVVAAVATAVATEVAVYFALGALTQALLATALTLVANDQLGVSRRTSVS